MPKASDNPVFAAIRDEDRAALFAALKPRLLRPRPDPNATDESGLSALQHAAADWPDADVLQALIDAGAAVDPPPGSPSGEAPLWLAAGRGHADNVRVLLAAGADANRVNPHDGTTALFRAVYGRHEQAAALLLPRSHDLTVVDKGGEASVFSWAFGHLSLDLIRQFVAQGANIHEDGLLQAAVFGDRLDHIEYLLSLGLPIDKPNRWGNTALMLAASRGKTDTVRWLLAHGADPAQRSGPDEGATTALDGAVMQERAETADVLRQALRERGASAVSAHDPVLPTDPDGLALMAAAQAYIADHERWYDTVAARMDGEDAKDREAARDFAKASFADLLRAHGASPQAGSPVPYGGLCSHSATREHVIKVRIDGNHGTVNTRCKPADAYSQPEAHELVFERAEGRWAIRQVWRVFAPQDKEPMLFDEGR